MLHEILFTIKIYPHIIIEIINPITPYLRIVITRKNKYARIPMIPRRITEVGRANNARNELDRG